MRYAAIAVMMLIAATPCSAESVEAAMKGFGLTGSWSEDCSSPSSARETYEYHYWGKPTLKLAIPNTPGNEAEIVSAVRATEEKIVITVVAKDQDGKSGEPQQTVFEKVGAKVRQGPVLFEKCLN